MFEGTERRSNAQLGEGRGGRGGGKGEKNTPVILSTVIHQTKLKIYIVWKSEGPEL